MKKVIGPKGTIKIVNDYVRSVAEYALQAEAKYGILAEVLIAQSAMETGWGRYILKDAQGCSNNLFNIKRGNWQGAIIEKKVHEYNKDGKIYYTTDSFRRYNNFGESFDDYCQLISNLPRYKNAYDNRNNPEVYCNELQKGGYATDPYYAKKIMSIIKNYLNITAEEEKIL